MKTLLWTRHLDNDTFSCLEVLVKKSDNTSLLYFDDHVERIHTEDGVNTNEKVEENQGCLEQK